MKYFAYRLLLSVPVAIAAASLAFFLIRWIPGDPAALILGDLATAEDLETLRRQMGLDQPWSVQLLSFLRDLFAGSWGESLRSREPVFPVLWAHFGFTLGLGGLAWVLSSLVALLGNFFVQMTLRQEMAARWNAAALVLMGVPVFVWSPFLVEFFGVRLRWFPISGSESGSGLFLPVLVLCCASTPLLFRQMQARFREIQGQDFLRVAYAKGLTRQSVFWRHELPVAFVAFLPYWFSHLSGLLAGSIVIEHIFDWPGMGHLLFESFQNRDYPMIQGILVFSTLLQVLNSALSDFLVQRLDPRVQWSASL